MRPHWAHPLLTTLTRAEPSKHQPEVHGPQLPPSEREAQCQADAEPPGPRGLLRVDLGALLSYEYFIIPEILSVKGIQGLYADCTAQLAGVTSIGLRARIFHIGRHRLYGGIGPTWIYRRNWYRLPGYVDTKYFEGSPTDKWQRKFLWYGGELEYKYALSPKLDIATTFVPGYPDLMAFAVGLSYNL